MTKSRLLSVAHASAEFTAGIPGHGTIEVRVLDDVTLRVHAGELLLVHATEPFARTMLLTVLAGGDHAIRRRYIRVVRDAAPRLRVRRAAIHAQLLPDIVRGWQEAATARDAATASAERSSPTLYLLRATRTQPPVARDASRDAAEWRRWARRARERNDGVVIAYEPAEAPLRDNTRGTVFMREPSARYEGTRATPTNEHRIRALEMRAGRLHDVRTPRHNQPVCDPTISAADRGPHQW